MMSANPGRSVTVLTKYLSIGALSFSLLLSSSASLSTTANPKNCFTGRFLIDGNYSGARMGTCEVIHESAIVLDITPETAPNHHSPWYGFRVTKGAGQLKVVLNYAEQKHRYWPKISEDGVNWRRLSPSAFAVSEDEKFVTFSLSITGQPIWISAQENRTNEWYSAWSNSINERFPDVMQYVIGQSIAARPITVIETNPGHNDVLLLIGRQHPAEVTGAIALQHFSEFLLKGHPSSCHDESAVCSFYRRTNIVIVPNLNPDGVELGHWRYSLSGKDLNRDWEAFEQPETTAVRDLVDRLVNDGKRISLFLDFHSTAQNVFYVQADDLPTTPHNFTQVWFDQAKKSETYPFRPQATSSGQPNAKNYIYKRFGIPAITYEVGDETDRKMIESSAGVFAAAMIQTYDLINRL